MVRRTAAGAALLLAAAAMGPMAGCSPAPEQSGAPQVATPAGAPRNRPRRRPPRRSGRGSGWNSVLPSSGRTTGGSRAAADGGAAGAGPVVWKVAISGGCTSLQPASTASTRTGPAAARGTSLYASAPPSGGVVRNL
jgi:hypothetical protein